MNDNRSNNHLNNELFNLIDSNTFHSLSEETKEYNENEDDIILNDISDNAIDNYLNNDDNINIINQDIDSIHLQDISKEESKFYKHYNKILNIITSSKIDLKSKIVQYFVDADDEIYAILINFITQLQSKKSLNNIDNDNINNNKDNIYELMENPIKNIDIPKIYHIQRMEYEPNNINNNNIMNGYKTAMLLHENEILLLYISNKIDIICKYLLKGFEKNASGSFYHICLVLDIILQSYPDIIYSTILNEFLSIYIDNILDYIEYAPVSDFFLNLISKPLNWQDARRYKTPNKKIKKKFMESLVKYKLLNNLLNHIISNDKQELYTENHNVAAADLMIELLNRLAADEYGDIIIEEIVHDELFYKSLVDKASGKLDIQINQKKKKKDETSIFKNHKHQNIAASRVILQLLQKCKHEKTRGPPTDSYHSFGSTLDNYVPNHFFKFQSNIFQNIGLYFDQFIEFLKLYPRVQNKLNKKNKNKLKTDDSKSQDGTNNQSIKYTSYVVEYPFSELRLTIINIVAELIEIDPLVHIPNITRETWRILLNWFLVYNNNSLYHIAFYRIMFATIRANYSDNIKNHKTKGEDINPLELLLKKLKLLSVLIEHYTGIEGTDNYPKLGNEGCILQILNVIRLHAATLPPEAPLNQFLKSHVLWCSFLTDLRGITLSDQVVGLGLPIPQTVSASFDHDMNGHPYLLANNKLHNHLEKCGIDHGSSFAKNIGFVADVAWPLDCENRPKGKNNRNIKDKDKDSKDYKDTIDISNKSKKKKKKRKSGLLKGNE